MRPLERGGLVAKDDASQVEVLLRRLHAGVAGLRAKPGGQPSCFACRGLSAPAPPAVSPHPGQGGCPNNEKPARRSDADGEDWKAALVSYHQREEEIQ